MWNVLEVRVRKIVAVVMGFFVPCMRILFCLIRNQILAQIKLVRASK